MYGKNTGIVAIAIILEEFIFTIIRNNSGFMDKINSPDREDQLNPRFIRSRMRRLQIA